MKNLNIPCGAAIKKQFGGSIHVRGPCAVRYYAYEFVWIWLIPTNTVTTTTTKGSKQKTLFHAKLASVSTDNETGKWTWTYFCTCTSIYIRIYIVNKHIHHPTYFTSFTCLSQCQNLTNLYCANYVKRRYTDVTIYEYMYFIHQSLIGISLQMRSTRPENLCSTFPSRTKYQFQTCSC